MNTLKTLAAVGFLALSAGLAQAVPVGDLCGNKYISLTQDGNTLDPTICSGEQENSTGNDSPIVLAGWVNGAELIGTGSILGDLGLMVNISTGAWSITNPALYPSLGISIKQGNGFAFYVLNLTDALTGFFYTGNNASPTGHGISHINAWYMGDPVAEVPVPAAGFLLLAGLAGLAAMRRRKTA